MTGARFDSYDWPGGRELLLRFGPDHGSGPLVIAALPLFEEANRTRQFMVTILRALGERGIAGMLPDMPGTGESLVATCDATIGTMRHAYAALADAGDRRVYAIGIRSGALLDTMARLAGRWHLTPQTGETLLRDLHRTRRASLAAADTRAGRKRVEDADEPVEYAGNLVSAKMSDELQNAVPTVIDTRIVRLESDPQTADRTVAGSPLWRCSEPANDPALTATLAQDIADWIAECEA